MRSPLLCLLHGDCVHVWLLCNEILLPIHVPVLLSVPEHSLFCKYVLFFNQNYVLV